MAEMPGATASTRRRLPGTRWSSIRMNWRWVVQAMALIAGIYFFKLAFDSSKTLIANFSASGVLGWSIWVFLFAVCFLALMFTSYLKERGSGTLRKRIAFFEKAVVILHLQSYSENSNESQPPA
jgi:hypothetical protein